MNAIQRWWLYSFEDEVTGQRVSQSITVQPNERPIEELWCRAKDVAELERVISDQSGKHKKITESLRERISFLERTGMDIQNDISKERGEHRLLRERHTEIVSRYDLLMQRNKQPARDPMCCNDYPECHHGR